MSKHYSFRYLVYTALLLFLLAISINPTSVKANENIPSIGNSSSNLVSIEQERLLGQTWLRSLRRHLPTYQNPIVDEYLSGLIYNLAPNSSVIDRNFSLVVVDSPALNAFAVPGSVIGVNAGLFLHAVSEQEFASVMAHELAHLGQRHYARSLERQQKTTPLALAGILASVIIAAAGDADAGMASLAATQAINADQQLRFSRQNEQEADRLGIETMFRSNYDPRAMPVMFERMFRQNRIQGAAIPEYLSTHPLSENRITDTRNRATQYPRRVYSDSLEYHLCRNMVFVDYAESPKHATEYFKSVLEKGNTTQIQAAKFGLAYALIEKDPVKARQTIEEILKEHPNNLTLRIYEALSYHHDRKADIAINKLRNLLKRNPGNYPITRSLATVLFENNRINDTERLLRELTRSRPNQPDIWYQLAEVNGLAGNIPELHRSRAEYFFLNNQMDRAIEQLKLAKSKSQNKQQLTLLIQQRIEEFEALKNAPPF